MLFTWLVKKITTGNDEAMNESRIKQSTVYFVCRRGIK